MQDGLTLSSSDPYHPRRYAPRANQPADILRVAREDVVAGLDDEGHMRVDHIRSTSRGEQLADDALETYGTLPFVTLRLGVDFL